MQPSSWWEPYDLRWFAQVCRAAFTAMTPRGLGVVAALAAERWLERFERETTHVTTQAPCGATAPETPKSPNPLGLDDFENSRGGTRTHDPGIMSAVL